VGSKTVSMNESIFGHGFLWPFKWLVRLAYTVLGMVILINIVYQCMGEWVWDSKAEAVAATIYDKTMNDTLSGDEITRSSVVAAFLARSMYWLLFGWTGLHDALVRFADPTPVGVWDSLWRNAVIVPAQTQLRISMWATQILGARIAIVLGAIPVLVLAYLWGAVEGLAERYVRRVSAGRESSGLYHRAKYFQWMALAFVLLMYLVAPYELDPRLALIPLALCLGFLARLQWMYYKKYL
jgi:integrating conjugative element membrane protein (TIGR03747 family)